MRWVVVLLFAFVLCGCITDGAGPLEPTHQVGVSQRIDANGEGTVWPLMVTLSPFLPPQPVTTGFRWRGNGTVSTQYPGQPHVWADGEFEWEPIIPGEASRVMQDQAAGRIRFSRRSP